MLLTSFGVPKWYLKLLACSFAISGVFVAVTSVAHASDVHTRCDDYCLDLALVIPASVLYLLTAVIVARCIPPYPEQDV